MPNCCYRRLGVLLLPLALVLAAIAADDITVSTETNLVYNTVNGPGTGQSALTENGSYLNQLTLRANGTTGVTSYSLSLGGKNTDDPTMDIKTLSLTQLQGRVSRGAHTLTVGDCFESFSQYALCTGLKGAAYRFGDDSGTTPTLSLIYGVAYPRWDNFTPDAATRALRRTGYGLRVGLPISPAFTLGVSGMRSADHDPLTPTDTLYDTNTYALDWTMKPIEGLSLQGEMATCSADLTTSGTTSTAFGTAYRFSATGDGEPSRVTLEYERVAPDFVTTLGSASGDREKAKLRWRYRQDKQRTWNSSLLWYHDNLDGTKAGTTMHWKPEVGQSIRRPFQRKNATLRWSTQFDHASGLTTGDDLRLNLGYTDQFGRWDIEKNIGFTRYQSGSTRDANEWTLNVTTGTRLSRGAVVYKPEFRLGTWRSDDELTNLTDRTYEYSAGLGMDLPDHNIGATVRLGQNRLLRDGAGDDSNKLFATAAVFYRPQGKWAALIGQLFLRAQFNNYRFSTAANNFRESSLTGGMNFQY